MPRLICFLFTHLFLFTESIDVTESIDEDEPFTFRPKHSEENDEFSAKIVGGSPVSLKEYPFSVQVYNMGSMCAGTILNSYTILTAAHCFDLNKDAEDITIHVGSKYSFDMDAISLDVQSFIVHHLYNTTALFSNDIALIFVSTQIPFSNKVKKAVLINSNKWMTSRRADFTVTGWGWTKYGGSLSKLGLMMTKMRLIPLGLCEKMHNVQFTKDMFCLYGDGQHDTCRGDSGGGVLWNNMVVGITSHGDGCARIDSPSVYTNVWYFRNWIKYHVSRYMVRDCNL